MTEVSTATFPGYPTSDFLSASQSSGSASLRLWMLSSAKSAPLTLWDVPTCIFNIEKKLNPSVSDQILIYIWYLLVQSYLIMPIVCGRTIISFQWAMAYQHSVKTHSFASLYVSDTIFKEQLNHPEVKT